MLNYQLTYQSSEVLKNSEYTDNYSSGYENWKDSILSSYSKVREALFGLSGYAITKHEKIANGVYCTTYSNNTRIYVNYTEEPVTVQNTVIQANNFLRVGGESE